MGQWKEVAGRQETHRKTHCWESESSAFPFMEYPHDSEFFFFFNDTQYFLNHKAGLS